MARILLAFALSSWVGSELAAAQAPRPAGPLDSLRRGMAPGFNLLLVTLDTTRADRLGCYGYAKAATPALDRLASQGIRFADAVSVAPETLVAHSSILTGLYPPGHGVRNNSEYRLAPGHLTLAEVLEGKGYETAAFVSAFVLDARYGLDQGFDVYDDRVDTSRGGAFPAGTNERAADKVTDAALAWLEARRGEAPFFVWVHYFDPHAPYQPPEPYAQRFAQEPYDGEVAFVDAQVDRLLRGLEGKGAQGRTLILVVGDHGESLGEHGELTHSVFIYESVMRVPLLLVVPGATRRGVEEDRVVSVADLLPTVLELLGVGDTRTRDGQSLLASRDPDRAVYMESLVPHLDFGWAPLRALRRRGDKYVLAPRPEYYDLAADPKEETNLAPAASGAAAKARDRLAQRLAALLARWPPDTPRAATAVDDETKERLQALGYLAGAGPGKGSDLSDPKDMIAVSQALIQANGLMASGQLQQALVLVQQAEKLSPRDRSVLHALAKVCLRLGRLAEAERALRAFRDIHPKADASLLLAQILILDGRHEEAARLLDEAAGLDPLHGGVWIARGDLLARTGRLEEARKAYERAQQVDPYRAAGTAAARIAALPTPDPRRH